MTEIHDLSHRVEKISRAYAQRFEIDRTPAWFVLKLQEEVGELTQAFLMLDGQARDKGAGPEELRERFRHELADVFCQTILLANSNGIDLESAVAEKWLRWEQQGQ